MMRKNAVLCVLLWLSVFSLSAQDAVRSYGLQSVFCLHTGQTTSSKLATAIEFYEGYAVYHAGTYTGDNTRKWKTCNACGGDGVCPVCHGEGDI